MKIIGITGGVGSGKSRILQYFEEKPDTVVYEADQIAFLLQKKDGGVCYPDIVTEFGTSILALDGEIDRKKLGAMVFSDAKKLQRLNEIVHPAVKETVKRKIMRCKEQNIRVFVLEAALLIEDHYEEICDELWYIHTEEPIRIQRLKESRGYTEEKIRSMMEAQLPERVFYQHCQTVIENSGSWSDTFKQLEEKTAPFYNILTGKDETKRRYKL